MTSSKITSLHGRHVALGARMVPFAGWDMPVSYPSGTLAEVRACRSSAGLFDVSHMGELQVHGAQAEVFLQAVTTNDISKLVPGAAQYSMLLNPMGGVKDDIIVYRASADSFMVVVNASCHEKDRDWILEHASSYDIRVTDISDLTALIAVQGPDAIALTLPFTRDPIASLGRFEFVRGSFGETEVVFSRTGYTGEDGFEIFCPWDAAPLIWDALVEAGAVPCGLGARDVLRLEAAYPLYGHELDETHTPLESGTGWATKLDKGEFIGSAKLLKQKQEGVTQRLVGVRMIEPPNAIARDEYMILNAHGESPVGMITSGTLSPTVGYGIAMARISVELAKPGTPVIVDVRGRRVKAEVVKLPFYRNGV